MFLKKIMMPRYSILRSLSRICLIFGTLLISGYAAASDTPQSSPQEESRITVGGSARIYGDWACKGSAHVTFEPGEALLPLPGFPGGIQVVHVVVPVSGFECNDSIVGNSFRKSLKEKEHPEIHFDMYSYELQGTENDAKVAGDFTIAGVTRNMELDAKVVPLPENGVGVSGSIEILMTDYGIKPPTALFGLVKVNNNVSVHFDLRVLASSKNSAELSDTLDSPQPEEGNPTE